MVGINRNWCRVTIEKCECDKIGFQQYLLADPNNLKPVLCCDDNVDKVYRSTGSDAFRFFRKLLDG